MKSSMLKYGCTGLRALAGVILSASLAFSLTGQARAQDVPGGRYRVLVVPMESSVLDRKFGEKVAERISQRLEDFSTHAPVPEKEFKNALKQYGIEARELDPIKARQLANLMGAQVVYYGTLSATGSSYLANADFIDVRTGDRVSVPPIQIGDKGNESVDRVANAAIDAFEEQVRFVRAQQFCAEYVGSQQPESALRNCREALAINPNSVNVLFNIGQAYRIMYEQSSGTNGWADSSISYFEKVLERQPSHREALQIAAFMYSKIGMAEKASELYGTYLEFDPANVPVRLKVAFDLANAGLMAEAIEIIQEGLEITEGDVDLLQSLGDYALRHSQQDSTYVDVALNAYEQVLEIKGEETDLSIVVNVIAAYTRANRTAEAIGFAERALESHSESARLWSLYADALARAGGHARAVDAMDRVIQLDSSYENAYLKRGQFKLRAGNTQSALSDFSQAIESGSSTTDDVFRLFWGEGHGARNSGDFGSALQYFELASRYASSSQRAELEFWWGYTHYQLGERQAGREDASVQQLRRALSNFQSAQQHFQRAGNVRREVAQLRDGTEQWLIRVEALIRRAERG